ncbi:MAG: flagellar basal body rod protein FlgC [Defluviicoccus sp.]|nr:flagellar basal body rod protein FlgC [Defluviicoccus sp.]MDG4593956.1 flagellar basal body rod protein FlgC [Defluviicoccus sp.]
MDDMMQTLKISAAGLKAQGTRLRVIAENVANANSLPLAPGQAPYQRRTVSFRSVLDNQVGAKMVEVARISGDKAPFPRKYDPTHPAADAQGYVETPNVSSLIEMADMREAQRSYEANLSVIRTSKAMLQETVDILR